MIFFCNLGGGTVFNYDTNPEAIFKKETLSILNGQNIYKDNLQKKKLNDYLIFGNMFNLTHNKKNANENYVDTNFHIVVTSISKSDNTLYWGLWRKKTLSNITSEF